MMLICITFFENMNAVTIYCLKHLQNGEKETVFYVLFFFLYFGISKWPKKIYRNCSNPLSPPLVIARIVVKIFFYDDVFMLHLEICIMYHQKLITTDIKN